MEKKSSKCKNCGSELWFNPKQGCLTCKYCKTNYFLPTKNDKAILVRQYNAGFHPNQLNRQINAYKCDSCGNIYYMASDEQSKKCTNCGSSSSTLVQDSGFCADGIIPFKVSKQEASNNIKRYLSSKSCVPSDLKKLILNQKIMGVFVPVWNFTFNVVAEYSANVTELKKDYNGMYYGVQKPVFGEEVNRISSLDETASKYEDDKFLDLFDENDYSEIIPYTPEYTFGYRVDSINKDIHDYYYSITQKAEKSLEQKIKHKLNSKYKEVTNVNVSSMAQDVFFNFTYIPLYINNYTYKGKQYKTYVSGTTGKVVGNTPKSFIKVLGKAFKYVALAGVIALIAYMFIKK